jgi:hypothetical protein
MNTFKWTIGFLFASLITAGIISMIAYLDPIEGFVNRNLIYYGVYHLFFQMTTFSLFTFLSCYFVPQEKKYAGLLAILITLLCLAIGLYIGFTDKKDFHNDVINIRFLINYTGVISGLLIGFYCSYELFKNKNWTTIKTQNNNIETY